MAQMFWVMPATVKATGEATTTATTGGPFRLPEWAPDIEWATTTLDNDWPVLVYTTTPAGTAFGKSVRRTYVGTYLSRTFSIGDALKVSAIQLTYRAVGELTRT